MGLLRGNPESEHDVSRRLGDSCTAPAPDGEHEKLAWPVPLASTLFSTFSARGPHTVFRIGFPDRVSENLLLQPFRCSQQHRGSLAECWTYAGPVSQLSPSAHPWPFTLLGGSCSRWWTV